MNEHPKRDEPMTMAEGINHVISRLPQGVDLCKTVLIERAGKSDIIIRRSVRAVHFLSTKNRNVATWLISRPGHRQDRFELHEDGHGRPVESLIGEFTSESIAWAVRPTRPSPNKTAGRRP